MDDFELAFDEISGQAAEAPPVEETLPEQNPVAESPESTVEAQAPAETPAELPAEEPAEPAPEPAWASVFSEELTEDQRNYLESIEQARALAEQRYRSDIGRQSAYQRQIEQLQRELQEAQAAAQQAATPPEEPEQVRSFRQEYPETAAAQQAIAAAEFDRRTAPQQQAVTRVENRLAAMEADAAERAHQEQLELLGQFHSDWSELNESEEYNAWVNAQPRGTQNLARSSNALEVAQAIDLFKLEQSQAAPLSLPPKSEPAPAPKAEAKRTLQRRGLKQQNTASPGGASNEADDDFDKAFEYYAKQATG